jgi:hypothetical protein
MSIIRKIEPYGVTLFLGDKHTDVPMESTLTSDYS